MKGCLRHAAWRSPSLVEHVMSGLIIAARSPGVHAAFFVALASRLAVLAVGLCAIGSFGYPPGYPLYRISHNEAVNLPVRWDVGWYFNIALQGYRWNPTDGGYQNVVFFPAMPMLMRFGAKMLGARAGDSAPAADGTLGIGVLRLVWVGMAISFAAFAAALAQLYVLARDSLGFDHERAVGALILLAAYPFAVYYSVPYTESLFLLAAVGAFRGALRHSWRRMALWCLLAGFIRPNGWLLAIPLAWIAGAQLRAAGRRATAAESISWPCGVAAPALAIAAACVGPAVHTATMYVLTGRPFVWLEAQTAWGRRYESVATLITNWVNHFSELGPIKFVLASPPDALNVLAIVFACVAVWGVYRRLGTAFAMLILVMIGPPLMVGGIMSMGRFTSVLFPMFLWLAASLNPSQRFLCVALFSGGQAFVAAMFFTWRPMV